MVVSVVLDFGVIFVRVCWFGDVGLVFKMLGLK